jgi:hypothetical protein
MVRTPTDRGIAFIKKNSNGSFDVYVAAGVSAAGAPEDVFAIHGGRTVVQVHPGVDQVPAGPMSRTAKVVHVSSGDDGVVHINAHRTDLGPLLV